ncbi:enoyl-CoA hydratase/carnithine racemase [Sphingopyxis panaciterrae]|uniref:enoyl-CoA hydratase/isomerase family protein n=1 Tax=Sphingopyxis panaciterrae TaxID=363841 RepID=UPI00141EFC53|nr:enoyl-CoA hydratase/isomerase family protein [Sphingopyxis panaciterrae]NIJ35945.1 enoyl-CoA hydratase/carnithine racemase [Sphingopyxis panaciterrae]
MTDGGEMAQLSRQGAVSLIIFHPARDGTISNRGAATLGRIFERELADDAVRAIVLTGASAGIFIRHANLGQISRAAEALLSGAATENDFTTSAFATLGAMLDAATKPIIAAINGDCMGGGFEIALACTMRIAAASASAIGLPEIRIGIPPGAGGPQRLARLIGLHRARLFTLEGTVLGAHDALSLGIVDAVAEDAVSHAIARAEAIAGRPRGAVATIMRQMRPDDGEAIDENLMSFARCIAEPGMADALRQLAEADVIIEQLN